MIAVESNDRLAPVALNIRSIPRYLRQRLKVYAAEIGKPMEDVVIDLIQDAVYSDTNQRTGPVT